MYSMRSALIALCSAKMDMCCARRGTSRAAAAAAARRGGGGEEGQRRTSMSWALAALFWRPVIVRVRPADGSAG